MIPKSPPGPKARHGAQDAAVSAVYRHVCADAAAAASGQNWDECYRLMQIARSIERAYPATTARARFAPQSYTVVP